MRVPRPCVRHHGHDPHASALALTLRLACSFVLVFLRWLSPQTDERYRSDPRAHDSSAPSRVPARRVAERRRVGTLHGCRPATPRRVRTHHGCGPVARLRPGTHCGCRTVGGWLSSQTFCVRALASRRRAFFVVRLRFHRDDPGHLVQSSIFSLLCFVFYFLVLAPGQGPFLLKMSLRRMARDISRGSALRCGT